MTDYMPWPPPRWATGGSVILRQIDGLTGRVDFRADLRATFDYAHADAAIEFEGGLAFVRGPDCVLRTQRARRASSARTTTRFRRLGTVWLIRDSETAVRAFSAACPHVGCGVELDGNQFRCPCHDSAFTLTGARVCGPSPRGMDPLEVRIADGWVSVRYQRFRQGVSGRIPV